MDEGTMAEYVTLIGTLPPIKGISAYCVQRVKHMSKLCKIQFIGFKKLYPEILYPGGTQEKGKSTLKYKFNKNVVVNNMIEWNNPFSWVNAALSTKSKLVHFHWWAIPLFPIFLTLLVIYKLRKKKIICTVDNVLPHEESGTDKFFTSIILKFCDAITVHSKLNKNQLLDVYKVDSKKIFVVKHPVNEIYKDKMVSKKDARKYLKLNMNDKIVLFFGNIREYKGLNTLIEAFAIVEKKIKNAKLIIAGSLWIDWRPYAELINCHGLENSVIVNHSYISSSEVKQYFSAADLIVLPYEKFDAQSGIGAIALAFAKPMVVTDVGALPELVLERKCIVKKGNYKQLAESMVAVLTNPKLAIKLSGDSKKIAQENNWENHCKELLKIYGNL